MGGIEGVVVGNVVGFGDVMLYCVIVVNVVYVVVYDDV